MDYSRLEPCLQALVHEFVPLSEAQSQRVACLCSALLLAGTCHLRRLARWLDRPTQQDSRVRWIERLLDAPYLSQQQVYQPWIRQALSGLRDRWWHVAMDRTPLDGHTTDLLTLSLVYRKRALPLVWQRIPFGGASGAVHLNLARTCLPLIPSQVQVVFHADSEFGNVPLMRWALEQGWHFVLGQRGYHCFRPHPQAAWRRLDSLPITPTRAVYLTGIQFTKEHAFGDVNLFAFYAPYRNQSHHKQQLIRYCLTSLPITPHLRQLGQRRWATECFYKDYKSSGWNLHLSGLDHAQRTDSLLVVLGLAYVWATCLGRWLCKTSQRHAIDTHRQRQLSLFRLGWDYIVHHERQALELPHLLTLYS